MGRKRFGLSRFSWLVGGCLATTALAIETQPAVPEWRLTEDLRLDASAHDLPNVRNFYVGPRGDIVVPIWNDMHVRIFDSSGRHQATIGRRGGGPGEFREMAPLGWKGDTMWVNDDSQRRVTFIAPNHSVSSTKLHAVFDPGPKASERAMGRRTSVVFSSVTPRGDVLGFSIPGPKDASSAQRAFGGDTYIVTTSPGQAPKQLALLPWSGDERWSISANGYGFRLPFTYTPQVAFAPAGDRFAHLWSHVSPSSEGTFTLSSFLATGDTQFVRTYRLPAVRIPRASRDSALAAIVSRTGATETGAATNQEFQRLARRHMPEFYAVVEFLVMGLDKTIWVGLHSTAAGHPVLVVDENGEAIARVVIPPKSRLRQASAKFVYVSETDDDGLVSIVRYRVVRAS